MLPSVIASDPYGSDTMRVFISVAAMLVFATSTAYASTRYTCVEEKKATMAWNPNNDGIDVEGFEPPKPPQVLVLTIDSDKANLERTPGLPDRAPLRKLSSTAFLELRATGSIVLWTLVVGYGKDPTFLFQQQAFLLVGPYAMSAAFRCT